MIKLGNKGIDEFQVVEYLRAGSESIVFKGIKKSVGRTYALKFQKIEPIDENRTTFNIFHECVMPFYKKLEEGSVSHIAELIPYVSAEEMSDILKFIPPEERTRLTEESSDNQAYFCIVEDYIQGCNLQQYCHGDHNKKMPVHCPSKDADYSEVQAYEKMIFNWIEQFCDIMSKVTDKNGVIHLDIKPENIMVTDDTKSLVLIDFGAAMNLDKYGKYDLNKDPFLPEILADAERMNRPVINIGTIGYASPEAYQPNASDRPELQKNLCGFVDQRSDIFSFGATLWNCLTPDSQVRNSISNSQYYNRDLFATPSGYSSELEDIIIKCTQKDADKRYASFAELKEASIEAEKKRPTSYKSRKTQYNLFIISFIIFLFGLVFMFFNIRSSSLTVQIAQESLHNVGDVNYNVKGYQAAAEDLLAAKADQMSYDEILSMAYTQPDGKVKEINSDIATVLLSCLKKTNDPSVIKKYVDTIMEKAELSSVLRIASSISTNEQVNNIDKNEIWYGRELANARKNLTDGKKISSAYETLIKVCENDKQMLKYQNVVYDIAYTLRKNSRYLEKVAQDEDITSDELIRQLDDIISKNKKEVINQ